MSCHILSLACRNHSEAVSFIKRHEPYCVALAEAVRQGADNLFAIECGGEVAGVLRTGATLLHCVPQATSEIQVALAQFLRKRSGAGVKTRCINGEACTTAVLDGILHGLGQASKQTNHYLLLALDTQARPPLQEGQGGMVQRGQDSSQEKAQKGSEVSRMGCGIRGNEAYDKLHVVRCEDTKQCVDALMPLQVAYEKEEVVPDCRPLSPAAIRMVLERALYTGRVTALVDERGVPVAKAALNAVGYEYVQIGGVYTAPKWRRRGCARRLVGNVCRAMLCAGRHIVLYVREENTAALRLYQGLGFSGIGRFTIVYY